MKINNNVSSLKNDAQVKFKQSPQSLKVNNNNDANNSASTKSIENSAVVQTISAVKGTFQLQDNLTNVQQKLDAVQSYQNNELNYSQLESMTYNRAPLFNKDELNNMRTDLSSMIQDYQKEEENLQNQLNSYLIANENTNAVSQENDAARIRDYLMETVNYAMQYDSSSVIDLLK